MESTAKLAGIGAAHGIMVVSGTNKTLHPLLLSESTTGERAIASIVGVDVDDVVLEAEQRLRNNEDAFARAALVCDIYADLDTGRTDALTVEAVEYATGQSFTMLVPYRPKDSPGGFAVYNPQVIDAKGIALAARQQVEDAFHEGVRSHEAAADVWYAHRDTSR